MTSDNIQENIQSVIQNVIPHIPRKVSNISSISVKTDSSTALPIYNKVREELESIEKLAKVGGDNSNIVRNRKLLIMMMLVKMKKRNRKRQQHL